MLSDPKCALEIKDATSTEQLSSNKGFAHRSKSNTCDESNALDP